jgi:Peptidase M15
MFSFKARTCALAMAFAVCSFGGTANAEDNGDTFFADQFKKPEGRRSRLGREPDTAPEAKPSLSGGVQWDASSSCLNGRLRAVVADVSANFGPVRVGSTCRGYAQNRRAGGAGHSYHLSGQAVDFRVFAKTGAVHAYLRNHGSVGGLKHYGGGLFHVDTGPRRAF